MKHLRNMALLGALIFGAAPMMQAAPQAPSKNAAKSALKTTTFAVSKMTCEGCANGLAQSLKSETGVKNASVNFKVKSAVVTYNPKQTNDAKLLNFFKKAGFPATVKKAPTKVASAPHEECNCP